MSQWVNGCATPYRYRSPIDPLSFRLLYKVLHCATSGVILSVPKKGELRQMKRIMVNVNEETYTQLEEIGKWLELSPSQVIRALLNVGLQFEKEMKPKIDQAFLKEIK